MPRVRCAATARATTTVVEAIPLAMKIAPQDVNQHVDNVDNIGRIQATIRATINVEEDIVEGHLVVVEIVPIIVDGVPFVT
jgi:hypothetical protein